MLLNETAQPVEVGRELVGPLGSVGVRTGVWEGMRRVFVHAFVPCEAPLGKAFRSRQILSPPIAVR